MKTYTAVAVDDEGPALRRMEKLIGLHDKLKLEGSAKTSSDAKNLILKLDPDILFLDIQLKESTAFELLKSINYPFKGIIVFITAYDEFAVKAFEYGAFDYLLKPFTEERFLLTVNRILEKKHQNRVSEIAALIEEMDNSKQINSTGFHFSENYAPFIYIKSGSLTHKISVQNILYLEKDGNYLELHTKDKKILTRHNMKDVFDLINAEDFIRVHKSYVVSINHITIFDSNAVVVDGNKIPIGRNFKADLFRRTGINSFLESAKKIKSLESKKGKFS